MEGRTKLNILKTVNEDAANNNNTGCTACRLC